MVTYYNRKDLGDFGKYLLSKERSERIATHYEDGDKLSKEERLAEVYHADVENWLDSKKTSKL